MTVTTTVGFGGAGGGAAVPDGLTVSVIPRCVVSLELQFGVSGNAIWMKNEKAPACVGVPDSVPLDDIERPGGEPPPRIDHTSSPGSSPAPRAA